MPLPYWNGGHDPISGVEPTVVFPGWDAVRRQFDRWAREAPFMLENALRAREEILAAGCTDDERRAWIIAEREVLLHAVAGVGRPEQYAAVPA